MNNYNFPDHVSGDTFYGIEIALSNQNGAIDLTGASIILKMKDMVNSDISTANDKIIITNAAGGVFQIKEQVINWSPFNYTYSLIVIFPNGKTRTYLRGSWNII